MMRPTATSNSTTAAAAGFWHWSSPIPYLFGGLAVMLAFVTVSLIILACSYRKSLFNHESRDDDHEDKTGAKKVEVMVDSDEPKIVVIMAGDNNPTFLAKPKLKPKPEPEPEPEPVVCNCQKIEQV
ncbi:protein GLUTAMINE DUMPER 6 [Ricinus communis]|uniref:Uncharacterized protein n=1 Tax=Ricinus communis TaxID=3988 RepID=B9TNG5_RICCO|nr:protein GLUTAMINE DUMPER 6 [Ricinus communis]EEF22599.1 conserved hypothetical protein [Ricinus communis]|eukprot:XP_002539784.1 protein GLUTAMINE DUMPER 6 [Ricinus communis]